MTIQYFEPKTAPLQTFVLDAWNVARLVRSNLSSRLDHWKAERRRKANLRFVMSLDPIVLRDLGFTREQIAARHDAHLAISKWNIENPIG